MSWHTDPDHPLWFDKAAEQRFRDERTAVKGAHLIDHDPEDDFGDLTEVKLPDPWVMVA